MSRQNFEWWQNEASASEVVQYEHSEEVGLSRPEMKWDTVSFELNIPGRRFI